MNVCVMFPCVLSRSVLCLTSLISQSSKPKKVCLNGRQTLKILDYICQRQALIWQATMIYFFIIQDTLL